MKKAAIVLLILLLPLVALPLGMAMAICPDSHLSSCPVGMCLALIALLTLGLALLLVTVRKDSTSGAVLLLVRSIEHPPRLA